MSVAEFIYTDILKPRLLKTIANAILLRLIPETIRIGPAVIRLNPNDPVISGALTFGVFERSELSFFQNYCQGDKVFLDIGANVGLYTALAMHSLSPGSRIVTIEPYPENFRYLRATIEANQAGRASAPRVDTIQMAAASQPGSVRLYLNPENKGDNRSYDARGRNWDSIEVQALTMDSVVDDLGIRDVSFIKMDVQGYEQHVLRGMRNTLQRSPRVILISEFWPTGLCDAGGSAAAFLQELTELGFTLFELQERPRGRIVPLEGHEQLTARLPGRKYANIIGAKGCVLS